MREEVEMLEHHAHLLAVEVDIAALIGDIDAVKENLSAGRNLQQVQAAEERRLAGAGRPDDDDDFALADLADLRRPGL